MVVDDVMMVVMTMLIPILIPILMTTRLALTIEDGDDGRSRIMTTMTMALATVRI